MKPTSHIKTIFFLLLTLLLGAQPAHAKTEVILPQKQVVFKAVQNQNISPLKKLVPPDIGFLKEKTKFVVYESISAQNTAEKAILKLDIPKLPNGIDPSEVTSTGHHFLDDVLYELPDGTRGTSSIEFVEHNGTKYVKLAEGVGNWMDDIYNLQKTIVNQNKNIIANATNNAKGAWGEMASDAFLTQKGYQPLHPRKTALSQGWGETGIDGVFKKDGQYYIVEAKYSGTSQLKMTNDGKQMSDTWIQARNYERLRNAVGNEADDIINFGYQRLLAKTAPDGTITYKILNGNAEIIGDFTP